MNLEILSVEAKKQINHTENMKELDRIYKQYLGKKGEITKILRSLKDLQEDERKIKGKLANQIKKEIELSLQEQKKKLEITNYCKQDQEIDITVPGKKIILGHIHPLTIIIRQAQEIFQNMGFSIIQGPEVETEWYNFDALNIPKDHPARDLWDTFWLKNKLLLRTHTSPVQIRYMEKHQPSFRIIAPGRVFRHEASDASHDVQFYQIEGLMVDKNISVANFKAVAKEFFQKFFNKEIKIRTRPGFFPFVEPGLEIDISCINCKGKGCSVCKKTGWLEILGAGMVHPNVLKSVGLNSKFWQGFAFGMGLDRLAMMKYKIDDIRLFYSGDLKFLEQF